MHSPPTKASNLKSPFTNTLHDRSHLTSFPHFLEYLHSRSTHPTHSTLLTIHSRPRLSTPPTVDDTLPHQPPLFPPPMYPLYLPSPSSLPSPPTTLFAVDSTSFSLRFSLLSDFPGLAQARRARPSQVRGRVSMEVEIVDAVPGVGEGVSRILDRLGVVVRPSRDQIRRVECPL